MGERREGSDTVAGLEADLGKCAPCAVTAAGGDRCTAQACTTSVLSGKTSRAHIV